jgi:hypothetical protein
MLRIKMEGHLTLAKMEAYFAPVSQALGERSPQSLIINVLEMKTYDVAARDWFVKSWSPKYRPLVNRLALVTNKVTWRMLTATVALATGQNMKAFASLADAESWADGTG